MLIYELLISFAVVLITLIFLQWAIMAVIKGRLEIWGGALVGAVLWILTMVVESLSFPLYSGLVCPLFYGSKGTGEVYSTFCFSVFYYSIIFFVLVGIVFGWISQRISAKQEQEK